MVNTFDVRKDGFTQLSENFRVYEFACPGENIVKIDTLVVSYLQNIRDYFGRSVRIGSGYRTSAYNAKINGATNSNHISGKAVDFDVLLPLINPRVVAMYAETFSPRPAGLGIYLYSETDNWTHIDNGNPGQYWIATKRGAPYQYVSTFLPKLKKQSGNWTNMETVKIAQTMLKSLNFYAGIVDGKFGEKTETGLIEFQAMAFPGLPGEWDGVCGPKTYRMLFESMRGVW